MVYAHPPETKRTILLVEDERLFATALERTLGREGFHVLCAPNASVALKFLREESVDLIVSDLRMPRMDGLEFRDALGTDAALATIPFVFLSGNLDASDREVGEKLGVGYFLEKPVETDAFVNLCRELTRFPSGTRAQRRLDGLRDAL